MKRFKISRIHIYNFKGFKNIELDLSSYSFPILGGKNGFGKTTIFDAIELVLSGKIKRMSNYVGNVDKRYNYQGIPLVFDTSLPEVYIELLIELQDGRYWFRREAKVSDMKNPIDFSVFSVLYYKKDDEKSEYEECDASKILPSSIVYKYDFLHYLDQEESTSFLKDSERERSALVCKLFNTEKFDDDYTTISDCKKKIEELFLTSKERLESLNQNLENLKHVSDIKLGEEKIEYVPLTRTSLEWDKENPKFTADQYLRVISENGILDNFQYYVENKHEYEKFKYGKFIYAYLDTDKMLPLSQYIFFRDKKDEITLFKDYEHSLVNLFQEFNEDEIVSFSKEEHKILEKFISEEVLQNFEQKISSLKDFCKTSTSAQQEYSKMISRRDMLIESISKTTIIDEAKCPLCGHKYADSRMLIDEIGKRGKAFKDLMDDITNKLMSLYKEFQTYYVQNILTPVQSIISNLNLSTVAVGALEDTHIAMFVKKIERKLGEKIEANSTLEATLVDCKRILNSLILPYDENIDYTRIETFYEEYKDVLIEGSATVLNVQKKRNYVISKWKESSSNEIQKLQKDIANCENFNKLCKDRKDRLGKMLRNILAQKKEYISNLISDIEILFYIYSGRIMQDNYYGRGIFMKNSPNRVLFVSGNYQSDVDVLYNMSSGQLTSVILSFTLALNKLYADTGFMAIDDPVQTIDDMNLWGFIETLRHEFHDYNILLSTHEDNYAGLLRYKLSKMDISSVIFDMKDMHDMK